MSYYIENPIRICIHCGNRFLLKKMNKQSKRHPNRIRYSRTLFCSENCKLERNKLLVQYNNAFNDNHKKKAREMQMEKTKKYKRKKVIELIEDKVRKFVDTLRVAIPRTKIEDIKAVVEKESKIFVDSVVNDIISESMNGSLIDKRFSEHKESEGITTTAESEKASGKIYKNRRENYRLLVNAGFPPFEASALRVQSRENVEALISGKSKEKQKTDSSKDMIEKYIKDRTLPIKLSTLMKDFAIAGGGAQRRNIIKRLEILGYRIAKNHTAPHNPFFIWKDNVTVSSDAETDTKFNSMAEEYLKGRTFPFRLTELMGAFKIGRGSYDRNSTISKLNAIGYAVKKDKSKKTSPYFVYGNSAPSSAMLPNEIESIRRERNIEAYLSDKTFPFKLYRLMEDLKFGQSGSQRSAVIRKVINLGYTVKKSGNGSSPFLIYARTVEAPAVKEEKKERFNTLDEALTYEFQMSGMIPHSKLNKDYGVTPEQVEVLAADMGFRRDYVGGKLYWVLRRG